MWSPAVGPPSLEQVSGIRCLVSGIRIWETNGYLPESDPTRAIREEDMPDTRKLLAELLGTYILVTVGGLAIASSIASGAASGLVLIGFGFGLALLAALYIFGEVSGGHFNPAVSLGALLDGRINAAGFAGYTVAQFAGAILGGFTLVWGTSKEIVGSAMVTVPGQGVDALSAVLIEALLTAVFVAVILTVTTSGKFGASAFMAISLTLVAIHFAAVPITGASVNPARTIATAVAGGNFTDIWIYFVGPLLGAVVGWVIYKFVATETA